LIGRSRLYANRKGPGSAFSASHETVVANDDFAWSNLAIHFSFCDALLHRQLHDHGQGECHEEDREQQRGNEKDNKDKQ